MDLNQDMVAFPAEAPPWDGINVRIWETSHENVIKPCRGLSCRHPVNCIVVRPERRRNVANTPGRHLASEHHGPGAEAASCQACEAAEGARGCPRDRAHRRVSREIAIANHRNRFGAAAGRITISAASQVGEDLQQYPRRCRNKLSKRQPSLRRMLGIWLARLFSRRNVQKRAQLQNLCRVHGDRPFSGVETDGIPLVLHQPGV